jgi:cell division protein ZapA (FtsZ GTPase activity inhibitor)
MAQVVHVDINGQGYAIRSDLDPQYIGELAAFLDERMRLASQELGTVDPLKITVVAALNIVDDLFRARADASGAQGRVLARTIAIERLVDDALQTARARVAYG